MSVPLTVTEFEPDDKETEQVKAGAVTVAGVPLQETEAMPERASIRVPVMVWGNAVTVLPLAGDEMAREGGVLSSFMVTDAVAVLAALSVTVPEITWLAVSVET